jgi:hypothetical protein
VLFSQPELAAFISETFEPAWTTLRPAPQVTIDFGEGRVVRRTLHGNVLTWICDSEGRALDAVPGIATLEAYRARLEEALALDALLARTPESRRDAEFRARHARRAAGRPLTVDLSDLRLAVSKFAIEAPVERAITQPAALLPISASNQAGTPRPSGVSRADLLADTKLNEEVRDRVVHEILAAAGRVPPAELTKRVFRDALGVDLDDPYLGLSKTLFESYPFDR